MIGVSISEPFKVELITRPEPTPRAGEALIRVKMAGICGSDIGAYRGQNPLVSYPRTIGHEIAGEVISIPDNAKGIKPGDKVVVDPYMYCGTCYPCSLGRTNCCEQLRVLGVHIEGGMVPYLCHPANMLIPVPEDMEWDVMSMAEPLTIALHGLHRARVMAGEHVAIIGAGTIGLLTAMAAQHYGAIPILIDIVEERLQTARQIGITHTIHSASEDPEQAVLKLTEGRKAEAIIEASGSNTAVRMTLDLVSHAGRIALTGWPKTETPLPTDWITRKEVDVLGSRTSAGEFEEAIELIHTGKVDVRKLLTKVIPVQDVVETIIDLERRPEQYLKVNVRFD